MFSLHRTLKSRYRLSRSVPNEVMFRLKQLLPMKASLFLLFLNRWKGKTMRTKLAFGLLVLAFACGTGQWVLSQTMQHYKCITTNEGQLCSDLDDIQCAEQGGGDCTVCYTTDERGRLKDVPLPTRTCVKVEGQSCTPNSTSIDCGAKYFGYCNSSGDCTWYDLEPDGVCNAVRGC